METQTQSGNQPGSQARAGTQADADMPVIADTDTGNGVAHPQVFGAGSTAFTTYYTWLANGVHQQVRFTNARVTPNSKVYVNISEYGANAQSRFIGAARMGVYNIAPYQGGFLAWVEISWNSPLKIRFDVLVDP
jgi:hypothetical protein